MLPHRHIRCRLLVRRRAGPNQVRPFARALELATHDSERRFLERRLRESQALES
jgi:predicted RNA polymerase sigma factor